MTPQEEILMLRALVEKQSAELKKKDEIIAKKDETIHRQAIQIENMMQALLHARKKMFGRSSEVSGYFPGQMSLFETTEELAKELLKEQKKVTVSSYKRTPRKEGVREEMLAALPKEVEEYIINEEDTCSVCGGKLKVIGKEIVRTEVEYQPARLKVKQIIRQVAKCTECGREGSENPVDHFQKAAVPAKVLSHSIATPSLVAQVMYQKFAMGIPLNRLERDFYRMGLVLSRASMAHWIIRCSEEWLAPIYDRIHSELLKCENLHMDETRIQVNKEDGKKASSESYMWVLQSGASEPIKATYFRYSRTRSKKVAVEMLDDYQGYLTTDAYTAYENLNLPEVKNNFCWAHVRRYYIESIPLDNNGKELEGSKGAEGREFINLLFLEDGRLEISNNLCEAHIRPFATARRSWLFADTPKGAQANAVLYTLVESARANELNIYEYLKHILSVMPNADFHNQPEVIDELLPWSEKIPDECRLVQKYKRRLIK